MTAPSAPLSRCASNDFQGADRCASNQTKTLQQRGIRIMELGVHFIDFLPGALEKLAPTLAAAAKRSEQAAQPCPLPITTQPRLELPKRAQHLRDLRATASRHATILVGTDAHRTADGPATLKPGQSIHHEMELLTRAGLSAADVLRGAAQRSAQVFNLADHGEVAVGKRAGLLLIDSPF